MEMHQLRYVIAVARTGNFSRAAEQCNVSQPSLSQQILKLEEELGERLFERMKRQTRLTEFGGLFLSRAARILEEVEHAKREAGDAKELLRGTLKLGVLPTIAPYLLPGVLAGFIEKYPGVEMIVQEDTTAQLLKLLASSDIDLAIASLPIASTQLEITPLFSEELLLALPAGHPLAKKKSITASDLQEERLIVMKDGHCLGDQVLSFCDRRGFRPTISFRSAQLETIQSLVRAGLGISLIPAMAVQRIGAGSPEYRSLDNPKPSRKLVALRVRRIPPARAVGEFLRILSLSFGKAGL